MHTHLDELHAIGTRKAASAPDRVPATNTTPLKLEPGNGIRRWLYADADVELFQGPRRPNPDNVDYSLATANPGMSPARERLEARGAVTETLVPSGPFTNVNVDGGSPNIDFSNFAYVPLLTRRALRCRLHAPEGGVVQFRLTACGAIRLWLGDKLVETFAPWSFNYESSRDIEFLLPQGATDLTVELENLHERNTVNYFAITYLSGAAVSCSVPAATPELLEDAMRVMDGVDFDRVYFDEGPLSLGFAHPPRHEMRLDVPFVGQAPRNHCFEMLDIPAMSLSLQPGDRGTTLPDIDPLPTGCQEVWVVGRVGDISIPKRLGTTVLTRGVTLQGKDVAARKNEVLKLALDDTGIEISVAMVHLSQGKFTQHTRTILEEGLRLIENRHDCSDFAILPALRIWRDYQEKLPADLQARLKKAILEYRYWMSEPGHDAMWFWSENHILCFHIAQLVAGHFFPEETFANSGRLGEAHAAEARQRLYRWFDAVETHGLGEWNSAAYYPIDLLALISLHDLSPDAVLKERSGKLMDQVFVMSGLHMSGGSLAGTQGRSYEKELLAGPVSELVVTFSTAFGGTYYPGQGRAVFSFCLSDYEPPLIAAQFSEPRGGDIVEAEYSQGFNHLGKLTLWKSAQAQLSTVTDHMTGQRGAQQHVVDAQFAGHPMARLWINHPGDRKPWSERRPSRLAGNHWLPRVAQHRNAALMIYDLPDDPRYIPYTQLFAIADAFDEVQSMDHGVLLRLGNAAARIWCSAPLEVETSGAYRGSIYRASGLRTAWTLSIHSLEGSDDMTNLAKGPNPAKFDPEALTLRYQDFTLDYATGRFAQGDCSVVHAHDTPVPHIAVNGGELSAWTNFISQG